LCLNDLELSLIFNSLKVLSGILSVWLPLVPFIMGNSEDLTEVAPVYLKGLSCLDGRYWEDLRLLALLLLERVDLWCVWEEPYFWILRSLYEAILSMYLSVLDLLFFLLLTWPNEGNTILILVDYPSYDNISVYVSSPNSGILIFIVPLFFSKYYLILKLLITSLFLGVPFFM
jgi:hypothetical protein